MEKNFKTDGSAYGKDVAHDSFMVVPAPYVKAALGSSDTNVQHSFFIIRFIISNISPLL
jgi:hypothetical protein